MLSITGLPAFVKEFLQAKSPNWGAASMGEGGAYASTPFLKEPCTFVLLSAALCRPRPPQLQEFQESVRKEYPRADVSCHYEYGAGVFIRASNTVVDEEFAYTVLGILQPIVRDEAFIQDLFALFEEEASGDHNWELGWRPDIRCASKWGAALSINSAQGPPKRGTTPGTTPIPTPGTATPPGMGQSLWTMCPMRSPRRKLKKP